MKVFLRFFIISFLSTFVPFNILNACNHCIGLRDDCLVARDGGGGASGKWLDDLTPKRGWVCRYAEDLGQGTLQQCEMCEREQVRYVHHMEHGNQNFIELKVGCICSGHMEGYFEDQESIENARARAQMRTNDLQNLARRRVNFPNLSKWKISVNGNPWIKIGVGDNKHHIIITRGNSGKFSARVDDTYLSQWVDTAEQAKFAAFDYLYPSIIQ